MIDIAGKIRQTAKHFGVRSQGGYILVGVLVIGLTLTMIGIGVMSFTSSTYGLAVRSTYAANAALVAEAGIERSLHELNANNTFAGYASEQTFFDDATQGKGVYTTVIVDTVDTNAKTITATGTVYRYGSTKVEQTRKVRVTVVGTASPGHSVHTGPGGLILSGSANITNSNVYVNGYIDMNGAARIGTSAQPSNVYVANYRCPLGNNPGATFPSQCSGAGASADPISLKHSTYIYGTVCATGQTSTGPNPSGNILPGSTGAGLQVGCTAPVVSTPTYDRAAHIAAVTATGAGNSNTYVCNNWPFDRTWPANLRLTGNVSIAGSCNLVITGDVYITGNLTLGGAATITIANSVGADRPNIIVDGTISVGGSARILANSQGTGAHFISFRSSASCNPNCTSLTGNDLYNSMGVQTVSVSGAVNLPGMIFQSHWGRVTLSGSGNLGAAIGQTVDMSGAGTVLFGTTLSSGTTSWSVTGYQRLFD